MSDIGARNAGVCIFVFIITRDDASNPGTPGTHITHQSVLNITPSVKMERNIVSDMGAGNAGVCIFVFIITRDDASNPGTPGTDITHKSVLNITPSVKMERNIMSDMGAGNAGVCIFV